MPNSTTNFYTAVSIAAGREKQMDGILSRRSKFVILKATPKEQLQGIDRWFVGVSQRFAVEYKCDERAKYSGNAFVETIADVAAAKQGWAHTSQSEYLAYWVYPDCIYWLRFDALRRHLPRWAAAYPTVSTYSHRDGRQWTTTGLLVPLDLFERLAEEVIST